MATGSVPSRAIFTSCALGARKRKVTLLSECTSGVFNRGGGCGGGAGAGLACCAANKEEVTRTQETKRVAKKVMAAPTNDLIVSHCAPQAIAQEGHLKIARRFNAGWSGGGIASWKDA